MTPSNATETPFRPLAVGALYPGIERGLTADVLAARALGGTAFTACTAHVVAGRGIVTDVLGVPTDSVSAQLEHLFQTQEPTGTKIGIIGHPATTDKLFQLLGDHLDSPLVLDLTLSGPSGEDLLSPGGFETLTENLDVPDLVTLRRTDAERVAGMEIPSLDDAQVALRRVLELGASRALLRCGTIPAHRSDTEPSSYAADLYYDGEDFALLEAPFLERKRLHGASSALLMALLKNIGDSSQEGALPWEEVLQAAKAFVTEALRHAPEEASAPAYFFEREHRRARPSTAS